jgi:hypothetical protein
LAESFNALSFQDCKKTKPCSVLFGSIEVSYRVI